MQKKRNIVIMFSVLLLLAFVWNPLQVLADTEEEQTEQTTGISAGETILDGVYIASVDVSGLTAEEAAQALENHMQDVSGYRISMKVGSNSASATASELGLSVDTQKAANTALSFGQKGNIVRRYKAQADLQKQPVNLNVSYEVDQDQVKSVLKERCQVYDCDPQDADMTMDDDGEFQITAEKSGITLRLDEAVEQVSDYLANSWREGVGTIELPISITASANTAEQLSVVSDILGSASTDYSESTEARSTNIARAAELLNGIVVFPGEEISVTDMVVPFDEDNGYAKAASYENGDVVETYGGGICQVSTTLYMALIRAEIEITERHNHSMVVKYVKPSMDAAIAEGYKDLRFTNNLENPIYIESYTDGSTIGFSIYGKEYRSEGREVTYESETLETTEPTTELIASEDSFGTITQVSASHTGYEACLWKIVTEDGEETKEEFNTSTYEMTPNKYSVGTKTSDSAAEAAIQAAIDSNDLDKVYQVINNY